MENNYSVLSVLTSSSSSHTSSPPPSSIIISSNGVHSSSSPSSSPSPPPPAPQAILSPCAACKILRRRCVEKCVLAPYFPPTDPLKFTIAHKVFGASNIIKLLQELPEDHRVDAVNSLVYEAKTRIKDPIYGCAGAICQLQKHLNELKAELARAQAQIFNIQTQNANLFTLICMDMSQKEQQQQQQETTPLDSDHSYYQFETSGSNNMGGFFLDDGNNLGITPSSSFEIPWT